jgi:hypothetical protein
MLELITDRTQAHMDYLRKLNNKSWSMMTLTEKAEWSGDPLLAPYLANYDSSVNIFGKNFHSTTASVTYKDDAMVLTPLASSVSQEYVRFSVGKAEYLAGQTVTFSFDSISYTGNAEPFITFRLSNSNENVAQLDPVQSKKVTFVCPVYGVTSTTELQVFVYLVRSGNRADAEASVTLNKAMLEFGSVVHEYVPYRERIDTDARKGAYNYTDLNRVETAVARLSEMLGLNLETKNDWGVWDIPTEPEMARYLDNVYTIRNTIQAANSLLVLPTLPGKMSGLDFEEANSIEKTLYIAYLGVIETGISLKISSESGRIVYEVTVSGVPNENIESINIYYGFGTGNLVKSIPKGDYDTVVGHTYEGDLNISLDGSDTHSFNAELKYKNANGNTETVMSFFIFQDSSVVAPFASGVLGTGELGSMILGQS